MKFQQGDTIISGPYLIQADGKAATPQDQVQTNKLALARISRIRGSHMILGVVQNADLKGISVEARYLAWDNVVEFVENYNLSGLTYLPLDSRGYKMTELLDREEDNVNCMIAWLQYDGQQTWIAKHQPEESK